MVCKIWEMLQQEWSLSMQTHIRRQVFMQFVHLRSLRSFLDMYALDVVQFQINEKNNILFKKEISRIFFFRNGPWWLNEEQELNTPEQCTKSDIRNLAIDQSMNR